MKIKIKCNTCGHICKPNDLECMQMMFLKYKSYEIRCPKCKELLRIKKEEIENNMR